MLLNVTWIFRIRFCSDWLFVKHSFRRKKVICFTLLCCALFWGLCGGFKNNSEFGMLNSELWMVITKHVCGGSPRPLDCARDDGCKNVAIHYIE